MGLSLTPSYFIEKENKVTGRFLGIPTAWSNTKYQKVDWTGELNKDKDLRVPLLQSDKINGTFMISNILYEFTERQYTIHFVSIKDIFAQVGGMRSSVLPIISLLLPFTTVKFLRLLADIMRRKMDDLHENECIKLAKVTHKQLLLARDAADRLAV